MPRREFATQKKLQDYAGRIGDTYYGKARQRYAKQQRVLSPDQYEIVDVRTSRGVRRAMLFPKAIIQAEWEGGIADQLVPFVEGIWPVMIVDRRP
jgi:hypothetical protein